MKISIISRHQNTTSSIWIAPGLNEGIDGPINDKEYIFLTFKNYNRKLFLSNMTQKLTRKLLFKNLIFLAKQIFKWKLIASLLCFMENFSIKELNYLQTFLSWRILFHVKILWINQFLPSQRLDSKFLTNEISNESIWCLLPTSMRKYCCRKALYRHKSQRVVESRLKQN